MAHPVSETRVKNLEDRTARVEQILPTLVTKEDLQGLKAELSAEVQATRADLRTAIDEQSDRYRTHVQAVAEDFQSQVKAMADGITSVRDEIAMMRQMLETPIVATLSDHETRLLRLEAKRRR